MSESTLPSTDPGTQKRRSTRIVQAVPITVSGVDALGQPFKERTTTVMVNCHGCKYQSKHYVPKNSVVALEIPRMEPAFPPRVVPGHVVWVQRPRTVRELFQIGLEFEAAGNVWGIAFPPEDWVPCAEEEAPAAAAESDIEVIVETKPAVESPAAAPVALAHEKRAPIPPPPLSKIPIPTAVPPSGKPVSAPDAASIASPSAATTPAATTGDAKIHVMPSPAAVPQDAQIVIARQMAKIVAEAKDTLDKTLRRGAQTAINEEMTIVRQQLDAQMHETVEHAIKSSMERVSEAEVKKVVLQAANKTAAIVEEARVASQANLQQIDAKVREAVQQAVSEAAAQTATNTATVTEELRKTAQEAASQAAEHAAARATAITEEARRAAQEAAEQAAKHVVEETVAQNLKQSVDELVGRAIAEHESKIPSFQALASPEAAQQHLDEFKKNLEETAQSVRGQMVAQTEAEAEAASRRWHEQLESMLAGSSQQLGERLSQVSQTSLDTAEKHFADRQSGLRSFIDDVVSGAEAAVLSLGNDLAQQRAQAEEAKSQLQETARLTVEKTRQQMDDMVAAQQDAIGKKAEEVIAARIQHIEPALQSSAQKVMNHFSGELDRKASSRIEEAQRAASELSDASRQAADLQTRLHQQVQQATEEAARIQESIQHRVQEVSDTAVQRAVSDLTSVQEQATDLHNVVRREILQASEQAAQIQDAIQERVRQASDSAVQKAVSDVSAVEQQVHDLRNSFRQEMEQTAEQSSRAQKDAIERIQGASSEVLHKALNDLSEARQQADQLHDHVREQLQRASEHAADIQSSIQDRVQSASDAAVKSAVAELAFAGQEAVRLQDAVREEIRQASEQVSHLGSSTVQQVQAASSSAAQQIAADAEAARQQSAQLQDNIRDQVEKASLQVGEIESKVRAQVEQASQEAAEIHMLSREQVRQASEHAVQEAIERMKQETTKFPTELEQTCRLTINKLEDELDQKSSEMQHSAYEALLKTSEWYQKKAQTSMQSTMERVVEQSSTSMRDKAGEVSSMVASELDHYRRTYLEHSRAEIEEASQEVTERERQKLNETAEIANATFTDRVQHVTLESLRRFQETSRDALEKARSDMEFNRDGSLAEFQKVLDDKVTQGVEQAATFLQSQLVPMLENWEVQREAEKHAWMQQVKKSSEESMEAYKARLENTTNAWLLASAATLGQNSQAVLDNLAKTAEKRMRDTCSQVLAGMGDVLKDRLMGISTAMSGEPDDPKRE